MSGIAPHLRRLTAIGEVTLPLLAAAKIARPTKCLTKGAWLPPRAFSVHVFPTYQDHSPLHGRIVRNDRFASLIIRTYNCADACTSGCAHLCAAARSMAAGTRQVQAAALAACVSRRRGRSTFAALFLLPTDGARGEQLAPARANAPSAAMAHAATRSSFYFIAFGRTGASRTSRFALTRAYGCALLGPRSHMTEQP